MSARKLDNTVVPVLGEKRDRRGPSALSEIKLTPRNELGAARVTTKSRKTKSKKQNPKTMSDAEAYIAELEADKAELSDKLKASYEENRDLGMKVTKMTRQLKSIMARAGAAIEGAE
ncbi:hypothetical protein [Marinobacter shengliensis]|uniref:hypothetical protein n=1 Tax=Marinobacter shengliensis TaxID=1389223 RepID=UPI00110903F1|nr:hypothetical protein [Marinobacter shengliensis]